MNLTKSNNPWIAGLSSFVIHLAILLLMAIWTIVGVGKGGRILIDSGISTDSIEAFEILNVEKSEDQASEGGVGPDDINSSILASDSTPSLVVDVGGEPKPSANLSDSIRLSGSKGEENAFLGSSLESRSPKNRATTGIRNGATQASEAAVEAALAYLANHQKNDGSWTLRFDDVPCQGQCSHGGANKLDSHDVAATGLALLCFMGAGHTMHVGEYSEQVSRGVYFLIQKLKIQSGRGTWLSSTASAEMYEHGIATLALCEALQMTGDESLAESCQAAIRQIIYAQHNDGGWDYHPKAPGDLSIVGWQVMALKSAVSAKLDVPADTIRGIDLFVRRENVGGFMFRYRAGKGTPSMTAIGNLMRILRGVSKTDAMLIRAVDYLADKGPSDHDAYYNYYATQVLFHYGGKPWDKWNKAMREFLIGTQEQYGHSAGSWWHPGDPHNLTAGRLYVTAMACLTLEVYYRYLPVYEASELEFKL